MQRRIFLKLFFYSTGTVIAGAFVSALIFLPSPAYATHASCVSIPGGTILPDTDCITLTSTEDAEIRSGSPGSNFGTNTNMQVSEFPTGRNGLVRFDLSSIPQGATITSAELKLRVTAVGSSGSEKYYGLHRVLTNWDETTVTWNTPGSTLGTNFALLPSAINTSAITGANAFTKFNVTTDVSGFQNSLFSNFGWRILWSFNASGSSNTADFATKENGSAGHRPSLQVNFTPLPASKLAITSVNSGSNPTAGQAFNIVVQTQDTFGAERFVTSSTSFTLSLASGSGTFGGTVSGTISAGQSSATVSGATYTKAEGGVKLSVSRTSGDVLSSTTGLAFKVGPASVDHFTVEAGGGGSIGTKAIQIPFNILVTAQDAFGNLASGFTGTVNFETTAGAITPIISGAFSAGARTESVTVNVIGTGQTISANDGSGHTGISNIFETNCAINIVGVDGGICFGTIQAAIDAATPGKTINVLGGTYTEQIIVNKSMTLQGAGAASTTIQAPGTLALETDGDGKSIVEFTGSITASMSGFTVRGPLGVITSAIHVHGGANTAIQNNIIQGTDVLTTTLAGHGITIGTSLDNDVDSAASGTNIISNNTVNGFHRAGIVATGAGNTANVSNNTVTGAGSVALTFQIGITLQDGATGSIINNTVLNNTGTPTDNGNGIFVWDAADGISVQNNTVTDNRNGVVVQATAATVSGNTITGSNDSIGIWLLGRGATGTGCVGGDGSTPGLGCATTATVSNNTLTGNGTGTGVAVSWPIGVTPSFAAAPASATLSNNTVSGWVYGLSVTPSGSANTVTISGSSIAGNSTKAVNNTDGAITVTATSNWWGVTTSAEITPKITGSVSFDPWYINPGRTTLSTAISGSVITATEGDLDLAASTSGSAELPGGITEITMSDSTALDLSNNTSTAASDTIVVAGASMSLSNFTSGTLSGTNLSIAQTVGGSPVLVGKAVQLSSGTSAQPVIIRNSSLSSATVSIPDDTSILAPTGWDEKIAPPKAVSASGTPPSGFVIGSTVIEFGSPDSILLFDKPVTLTLTGITGEVGYKPAGSGTWTKIGQTCGGTFASPADPVFPGECKTSNGNDTKIVTYHLTTFGTLNTAPPPPSGGGGGGGGGGGYQISQASPTPTPFPTSTPSVTPYPSSAPKPPPTPTLKPARFLQLAADLAPGMINNDVRRLQEFLASDPSIYPEGLVTGYYGPLTTAAVKRLQARYGVVQLGRVGPETREKLLQAGLNGILIQKPSPASSKKSDGTLVRYAGNPKVYVLDAGKKRWVPTAEDFVKLGYRWTDIITIPSSETYPDGTNRMSSAAPTPSRPINATIVNELDPGAVGEQVRLLQEFLAKDPAIYPEGLVTGYYGPLTTTAVRRFQTKYGISAVGRVGPETLKKLNELITAPTPKPTPAPPSVRIWPIRAYNQTADLFKVLIDLLFR